MSAMNVKEKGRRWSIFTHVIVILIIIVVPELMLNLSRRGPGDPTMINWGMYLKVLVYVAVFYINYLVLIEKMVDSQGRVRMVKFLGINLVVLVVAVALCQLISYWCEPFMPMHHHHGPGRGPGPRPDPTLVQTLARNVSFMMRDAMMVVLIISLAVTLRLTNKWQSIEQKNREIVALQRATELENLKNQLNPHFLFNTLNSIYALIDISPDLARDGVHRLSKLLRYVLYENPRRVELRHELEFVENYVELMRMRLNPGAVRYEVDADLPANALIAPMIFISQIENAIKHGKAESGKQPITISIMRRGDNVVCRTSNYVNPEQADDGSTGIGVSNMHRRLELIYGDKATYTSEIAGGCFVATLTVPLNYDYENDDDHANA